MHMADKTTTKNNTPTLAFYLSSHVALEFISILMTEKCTSNLKTFDQDKNITIDDVEFIKDLRKEKFTWH